MPLQIVSQRGIRLNKGLDKTHLVPGAFVANTTLSYPGLMLDRSAIDFDANVYENTLTAITNAWLLGYKVAIDVYSHGVIHRSRYIGGDRNRLIDSMTPEDIAQVNLSQSDEALHDGNRIPTLEEVLEVQWKLKNQGDLMPPPRLQLELRKPVDVVQVVGAVMERLMARQFSIYDVRIVSCHYDLLVQALDRMADYDIPLRPEVSYIIRSEALNYAYLNADAPDYIYQLKAQAMETIPFVLAERLVLTEELEAHFPELAGLSDEQMEHAIPDLIDSDGIARFTKRYEAFLAVFIGEGLHIGYHLSQDTLEDAAFDSVLVPMNSKPGVTEAYLESVSRVQRRGRKLRVHAHQVCREGRHPAQLLRAFAVLDENSELSLDYPEMIPWLFADISARGISSMKENTKIALDPTRKVRLDNLTFTKSETELAIQRFFQLIGIPFEMVADAPGQRGKRGGHISFQGITSEE
jgi:hypothetical protein